MKRRHELSVADPSPLSVYDTGLLVRDGSSDAKATRQISKRRRVVGPNAWDGASRLNSALQDINNLSHHSTIPPKDVTISRSLGSQPIKTTPPTHPRRAPSLSRPAVPRPMSEPVPPSLHDSTSKRVIEPKDTRLSPGRSLSEPMPSVQPNNSDSIRFNPPPSRFISQDKPVRIRQFQGFQHGRVASQTKESDSDSEDEGEADEVTDDENVDELTEETPEDSAERGVVENRYADINK
ncbi:hypothetical protein FRC08_012015 [Ceratobasidium sp. 394]|nr:hypothetical protein FRC08_012015 [Ceratobasidium sp. 394]